MSPPTEQLIRDYLNRLSVAARGQLGSDDRRALVNRTRDFIERKTRLGGPPTAVEVATLLSGLGDPAGLVDQEVRRLAILRGDVPQPTPRRPGRIARVLRRETSGASWHWPTQPGSRADLQRKLITEGANAGTEQAGTGQAGTGEASTGQAGTGQVSTGQAGTGKASTGQAGTGKASTGQAGTEQVSTGQAGTGKASTGQARAGQPSDSQRAAAGAAANGTGEHDTGENRALEQAGPSHDTRARELVGLVSLIPPQGGPRDHQAPAKPSWPSVVARKPGEGATTELPAGATAATPADREPPAGPAWARRGAAAVRTVRKVAINVIRWSRRRPLESAACVLMGLGGAIYPPVWLLGAAVALGSRLWDYRDKWLGLAAPVLLTIAGPAVAVSLVGGNYTLGHDVHLGWVLADVLSRVFAVLGASYLTWRSVHGRRPPKVPPWNKPRKVG